MTFRILWEPKILLVLIVCFEFALHLLSDPCFLFSDAAVGVQAVATPYPHTHTGTRVAIGEARGGLAAPPASRASGGNAPAPAAADVLSPMREIERSPTGTIAGSSLAYRVVLSHVVTRFLPCNQDPLQNANRLLHPSARPP